MSHSGGHLPFEADITDLLAFGGENLISVALNNTLNRDTVPQGEWNWRNESDRYPAGYFTMDYAFDFLNYAGIHRCGRRKKIQTRFSCLFHLY